VLGVLYVCGPREKKTVLTSKDETLTRDRGEQRRRCIGENRGGGGTKIFFGGYKTKVCEVKIGK
jgi:hypothetical protein